MAASDDHHLSPRFIEGGTRLTMRHDGFGDRVESCAGHAEGWERVLGWLADFVAVQGEGGGATPKQFFFCRLLPPRPTFAMDMNAAEGAAMREHAAYWTTFAPRGVAVIFGPVMTPRVHGGSA